MSTLIIVENTEIEGSLAGQSGGHGFLYLVRALRINNQGVRWIVAADAAAVQCISMNQCNLWYAGQTPVLVQES